MKRTRRLRRAPSEDPEAAAELRSDGRLGVFPCWSWDRAGSLSGGEHHHRVSGQPLSGAAKAVPADADLRLEVRLARPVLRQLPRTPRCRRSWRDRLRAAERRDQKGSRRRTGCSTPATTGSTARMVDRKWAVGEAFTLADCAAAPALFYADWVHPIGGAHHQCRGLSRPVARAAIRQTCGG